MNENKFEGYEPTGEYREVAGECEWFVTNTHPQGLLSTSAHYPMRGRTDEFPRIILRKVHQHIYKCDCGEKCHE